VRFTERLAFVRLDEAEKALEATETLIKNIESSLVNAYVKLSKQVANFDTKYKEHWIQVVAKRHGMTVYAARKLMKQAVEYLEWRFLP
jgi:hypothetical protein